MGRLGVPQAGAGGRGGAGRAKMAGVVNLCGGVLGRAPEYGRPPRSASTLERVRCAAFLARQTKKPLAFGGGNAVATDQVPHRVDPWPRDSANRDIAYDGDRMQPAVERYRTNKVTPPRGIGTSATYQPPAAQNNATPVGPTVTQQPVK